ncbi:2-hydroxyacid dehydrogenase [Priestia megaterium]|uniref:2-hydroxyacid dehydrogenase n=1 Tax=Priestia megaterium TaxID=1404 RepID=UPI001868C53B|nr:D-glycerate dehydrogenase [Priestia megaterium]MBE2976484.1 D-glycerate dehydrogenase [Priestia megaterium]
MDKPFVFITRKIPNELIEPLKAVANVEMWDKEDEAVPHELLCEKAKHAHVLLTMLSDRIDSELLTQAPHLKLVANLAVGFDNIDVEAATERGIIVSNTPDVLSDTTADLTFGLLMSVARRLVEAAGYVKENQWKSWSPFLLAGRDVHHKTLGIVGMGKIGEVLAKRATGFDMEILYHNRSRNLQAEKKLDAVYCELNELFERSDFVVCLTPLTDETKHLFNASAFEQMKTTAIFINASRGAVVDEQALLHAVQSGEIAGAGLDVFNQEPISASHPLLQLPNVVALPHIGSASIETRTEMISLCVKNIKAVLTNESPITIVNKEAFAKKS